MSDDPNILIVVSQRRRGRPRLSPSCKSTSLSLKVPEDTYDRACQVASAKRMTLPEFLREAVDRALRSGI